MTGMTRPVHFNLFSSPFLSFLFLSSFLLYPPSMPRPLNLPPPPLCSLPLVRALPPLLFPSKLSTIQPRGRELPKVPSLNKVPVVIIITTIADLHFNYLSSAFHQRRKRVEKKRTKKEKSEKKLYTNHLFPKPPDREKRY